MTAWPKNWIDLAQPRLGATAIAASDDFFAPKERLIDPREPVFIPDKYDDHGKWMDGWESRRKRTPGHDWALVRLGVRGVIRGVVIDTRFFTGNYPPFAGLEACDSADEAPETGWVTLIEKTPLAGNQVQRFLIDDTRPFTHVRLNIFPDGGVARLRLFGEVAHDWAQVDAKAEIDLAAMALGGQPLFANDEHFGTLANLLAPGRGINMGDGWETRRRREPGHDWAVIALGHSGVIDHALIDTAFFKGNYPDRASLQAARISGTLDEIVAASKDWPLLLGETKLEADREHHFQALNPLGPVSHVRLNIFPDGGVSRLRLFGRVEQ